MDHLSDRIDSAIAYVPRVARRYLGCGVPFDELLAAGNLGLVEAALRFDPERGVKFVTYADWWIRKSILQVLERQLGAVRLPRYRQQQLRLLAEARRRFRERHQQDPDLDSLSQLCGLSPANIRKLDRIGRTSLSLDEPQRPDGDRTFAESLIVESGPDPQESAVMHDFARHLRGLLQSLAEKEKRVLHLRFGFGDREPMTLRAIGSEMGISRERVRQVEGRALRRLRERLDATAAAD